MKKVLLVIVMCITLLVITGCCSTAEYKTGSGFSDCYWTYVDDETGVNYIVFTSGYKGGICPRYNTDGSLYVTK